MALSHLFRDILAKTTPAPKPNRGGSPRRFSKEDVELIYASRKRGFSWTEINIALEQAGEEPYKRPESLSQSVHNAAKQYGIEPPFPGLHRPRKKKAQELVHA